MITGHNPLVFYTDPHIGLTRSANTTQESSQAWRNAITLQALGIAESFQEAGWKVICGGDVFDKYSNSEASISAGTRLMLSTNLTIAGNHDVTNSVNSYGSLQLVDEQMDTLSVERSENQIHFEPGYWTTPEDKVEILTVPHVMSQKEYVKQLKAVAEMANDGRISILLTHANYDIPPHWVRGDVTLNIPPELAEELLKKVDYIIVGHEHTYKSAHKGRLILPGTPFPTAFDNIEDKFILEFTDGIFSQRKVFDASAGSRQMAPYEIEEDAFDSELRFVTVSGEVEAKDMLSTMRRIGKAWAMSPDLLGLKMDIRTVGASISREAGVPQPEFTNIADRVASELEAQPDLMALWNRIQGGEI